MSLSRTALIESLLNDRQHHIEFNGHLTNHNKHAVIALARLGASEQRIKNYYDGYADCTPYGYGLEPARITEQTINADNWTDFLGKRTAYSAYYDFFDREERRLGTQPFLEKYIPFLIDGWASALTHATIHLGWALDIGNRCMMLEGVAYLAFSYISCHPERAVTDQTNCDFNESAFDSLLFIAKHWQDNYHTLHKWAITLTDPERYTPEEKIHPELRRSGLQYKVAKILQNGHPLIYKLPVWLNAFEMQLVWQELRYVVTLIFLNEPGDFLLLHFMTSLHAMEYISCRFDESLQRQIAKNFWIGFLCILFCRAEFPVSDDLKFLHTLYHLQLDPFTEEIKAGWQSTVSRAIAEEEEHNPKMVYVLKKWWEDSQYQAIYRVAADYFTVTPELPKSFDLPVTL